MGARLKVIFEVVSARQYASLMMVESFKARWQHSKTGKLVTHMVNTLKPSFPEDNPELYGDLPRWGGVELKTQSEAYNGFAVKAHGLYLVIGACGRIRDAVTLSPQARSMEGAIYRYG